MSRQTRFSPYYDQLKTELITTYGTDFPPLDPSNPNHQVTLEDCARLSINQEKKNFLIAWRQVVDKTGWTLEEEKEIADILSSCGHGIDATPQLLTTLCQDPMNLLVCSFWFWKRQDEVEKVLDEEDRQAIMAKINDIASLPKSLAARKKLEDFEGQIKERQQKDASIKQLYVERRTRIEQQTDREQVSQPTISVTPPTSNEKDELDQMTSQQLMDSHNANLGPGDLKLNLTQFEKLMEFSLFTANMKPSPDLLEVKELAIQYIILYNQYYRSLLSTYPKHTLEFKCPYYKTTIIFRPTEINMVIGIVNESYLCIDPSSESLRKYLTGKFNYPGNRQRALDYIGRGWTGLDGNQ